MRLSLATLLAFASLGLSIGASRAVAHSGDANEPERGRLQTVPYVDVAKYAGRWYQIARNPLFFEPRDCACAQQTLGATSEPGVISVYNSCTARGRLNEIRGTATNDDPNSNSRFTVDFGMLFKGQYWIIGLDPDYRWAVVSDPWRWSLYILSKTPTLSEDLYEEAVAEAAKQIDTSRLKRTSHVGCTYPQATR